MNGSGTVQSGVYAEGGFPSRILVSSEFLHMIVAVGLAGGALIGYLEPNRTLRETTVDQATDPMIDWGHVRPNLSGLDRVCIAMGGTRASVSVLNRTQHGRPIHLQPAAVRPRRPIGTPHASFESFGRTPACSARAGRRLRGELLRVLHGPDRPRGGQCPGGRHGAGQLAQRGGFVVNRLGEPAHTRGRRGHGRGPRRGVVAARPHRRLPWGAGAGIVAQRRQSPGTPDRRHARRGAADTVLPNGRGGLGTRCCASRPFQHPIDRRTTK